MMNHPDSTYMVVKSLQQSRRHEAAEFHLASERALQASPSLPSKSSLRCRLLSLGGGKVQLKALSLIHANGILAVCQ